MRKPFLLTYENLHRLAPRGKTDILKGVAQYSLLLEQYGIAANELRLAHFLAQAAHETAGFRTLTEFGTSRYFRRRYGHRRDLGNKKNSDGSRYRGRGIFQLTGRANYRRYGKFLKIDLEAHPLWAKKPETSLHIACEYWRRHNLNHFADRNDIRAITKRINGGFNGLRDRRRYFKLALSIWSPGASALVPGRVLQIGDSGSGVRKLQKQLRAAGFIIALDGLFGRQTKRVLKAFQSRHHLASDGLFGPRVRQKLYRDVKDLPSSPSKRPKENIMTQWKSYLSSRTIWANLIGFGALALDMFGFNGVSGEDQSQLVDQLLKLVEASGFVAGVVFRALARDRLGPTLL